MRAWVRAALCLALAEGLRASQLSSTKQSHGDDPEDVAGLKELVASLRTELKDLHEVCDPLLPKTTEATTTATTTTTTTTTRVEGLSREPEEAQGEKPRGPATQEIGTPGKKEAAPIYKPPIGTPAGGKGGVAEDAGKPDDSEGYDYHKDGDDWANSFSECSGDNQSPVDLPYAVDIPGQTKGLLWFDYYTDRGVNGATNLTFMNAGHGVFANLNSAPGTKFGKVKLMKDEYTAQEVSFHAPSEHKIGGRQFPLEAQILNTDKEGRMIMIAVMFEKGEKSNAFLKALKDGSGGKLPRWSLHAKTAASVKISGSHPDAFNLEKLLPYEDITSGRDLAFFNYEGSLTQPPCTGGVNWWVLANPIQATEAEILDVYSAIMGSRSTGKGNARKTQKLGSRTVTVGHVGFAHNGMDWRRPGQETFPKQARGHNTLDHPWKPQEAAHWSKAATAPSAPAEKPGKVWKYDGSKPVVPSDR